MIRLHRLSARAEVFYLNPDLIVAIDSTPDTVVTLTTHQKVLVADSPEAVVAAIQEWRASILATALPTHRRKRRSDAAPHARRRDRRHSTPNHDNEESDR